MYTPGYEVENQTKPKVTKRIEETDPGLTAEQAALALLKGERRYHVYLNWCELANRCGEGGYTYYCRLNHKSIPSIDSRCYAKK